MEPTMYTIGYAAFSRDDFLKELKENAINVLIDVRSEPYSLHHPEYNADVLRAFLKEHGIYYRNYAKEFGARQENLAMYSQEGYLDFEKVAKSTAFQSGVARLCNSMQLGYTPALMCAEKNPIDCHRAILVSRAFYECGYPVLHIMPGHTVCTQKELNQILLEKYFPNRNQISLFGNAEEEELIRTAYRKRNAEIGYRMVETA